VYWHNYVIKKLIHPIEVERTGTHTQTKVCTQTNFHVWILHTAFSGPVVV